MNESDFRIVFASCALIGLASQPLSVEAKAKMAWELADAMLNADKEEDSGIVSIKRKRGKVVFD